MPDSPDEFYDTTARQNAMETGTAANGLLVDVSRVQGTVTTTSTGSDTPADAHANPTNDAPVTAFNMGFNGTTWDRVRTASATADPGNTGVQASALVFSNGATWVRVQNANADGQAASSAGPSWVPTSFNGSTWDRQRGNQDVVVLASAARTTTQTGADQTNHNAKYIVITTDVTNAGTGSITTKIQGKDANGVYYDILAGAAITTVTTQVLRDGPGLPVTANVSDSIPVPRIFRIVTTANNANSVTYSVAYSLIV